MKVRICPYCREKIKRFATVCRYCRKDIPAIKVSHKKSIGVISAILATALIAGGVALITAEYLKERRNWLKK
ncbi:MAG: hypothetical protein KKE17_15560 [Proteobacteria bacterium]|nr:hypothetical protein [Pseudomonadota bacterium]MBU1711415.1 hypothetical protein [Pseudomonadota bacterium]